MTEHHNSLTASLEISLNAERARVAVLEAAIKEMLLSLTWGRGRTCFEEVPRGDEKMVCTYGGGGAGVHAFIAARAIICS